MSPPLEVTDLGDWKVLYDGRHHEPTQGRRALARTLSIPKSMYISSDPKPDISTVTEIDPKLKLPRLSEDATERVFPVRSVVSFDSTPSSALQTPSLDKLESPIPSFTDAFRKSSLFSDKLTSGDMHKLSRPNYLARMHEQRHNITPLSTVPTLSHPFFTNDKGVLVSSRATASSSSSSRGKDSPSTQIQKTIHEAGEILAPIRLTKGLQFSHEDDAELIIQQFGVLMVITQSEDGLFPVQVASSNSNDILGISADELFELKSFCDILSGSQKVAFLSHVSLVLEDEYDVEKYGPEIFCLHLSTLEGGIRPLWCTMHTSRAYKNFIICEMESEIISKPGLTNSEGSEKRHSQRNGSITQALPEQTYAETRTLDTINSCNGSTPKADTMDSELLNSLPRILRDIARSQALETLLQHVASTLQKLTQFDRITIYHFDGDQNGEVLTDIINSNLDLDRYEGIHFQESTFPDDLKKCYLRNTVSFSYREGPYSAGLIYRASTSKLALDLSHCYLPVTPVSPEDSSSHPLQACISIGVYVFGKLWGIVSCQSYDEDRRLHPLLQKACWIMSDAVSSNVERLSYTLSFPLQNQSMISEGYNGKESTRSASGDLLSLFGADYAAASILQETKILGKPNDSQEVLALLEYLRAKDIDTVLWSTDIASDFEDLDYSPGFRHLSGLLYTPLSADGKDFIIFFRSAPGSILDSPHPVGITKPVEWSATDFGKASILSLLYRTFTDTWQEKEAAMQNNQLMRLLLANSAHEFRTPLNAIINYLEIVLDGNLDQETRENLSRSHSASKSLVYIINDLLDLINAENGQRLIKDEVFSLSETLCESTDIFWEEARQKHVDLQVIQHSSLPPVLGDQRRVRQVITNLISNAVQNTSTGAVTIESCTLCEPCEPGYTAVEVAIHDTGSGMSQEVVETLFCELEQVSNKDYMQAPKSYAKTASSPNPETDNVLGLGLALVARIVRNMDGQLSLKSEEGKGSCFKIRLKFELPATSDGALASAQTTLDKDLGSKVGGPGMPRPGGPQASYDHIGTKEELCKEADNESQGISCQCGDRSFPGPGLGQEERKFLDVDVALKTGESRNITIPAPHPTPDKKTKSDDGLVQNLFNAPAQEVLFASDEPTASPKDSKQVPPEMGSNTRLRVLVAEDDPVNSTILSKRLEKFGYSVSMTGNGKECAAVYRANPGSFDAVLMDLQMPIVDGLAATKMIREHENQAGSTQTRVPVFAVSASLMEKDRQTYVDSGFDGWIMKPIDFQRVHVLLDGVKSPSSRNSSLYRPGVWEEGGWFTV
ncbi:hypothetical protein N7462_003176 [Penicillium macrosclerotiorum]|uniref:uncharacterized protein n=1 Tax=Penicillium macrosclerotiorum TaxID=303699 RepID=UPI00254703B4|nr:uncharacterized protein N7462_003176 [Penicillium macrosclerotiorum]KAJ5688784.1 hypothetical protein N7462_003176 [Penicillium macrosclerotiorum]